MKKRTGVLFVTDNDAEMIKSKHWLVSRGITYRTYYLPIEADVKKPVVMAEMTLIDKVLFRLTFGCFKTEKVTAFI